MEKLKHQAANVGQLLISAETGAIYGRAVARTWEILRETGRLLWLVICWIFVGTEWFWHLAIRLGRRGRNWYEALQSPKPEESKAASEIGQSLLLSLSSGTETLLYQAKQQLGIEANPPMPKVVATQPNSAPQIGAEPSATAPSAEAEEPAKPIAASQGEAEPPA